MLLDSTPGMEHEVEQTTTRHNHSVHWLTEDGDIMVPVTNEDHEMTTLVKIGNIESETESSFFSETTTAESEDLNTVRSTINEVISAGGLPRLVALLARDDKPEVQYEAAWAVRSAPPLTPRPNKLNAQPP